MWPTCALHRWKRIRIGTSATHCLLALIIALHPANALNEDHSTPPGIRDLASSYGSLVERYVPDFFGLDRNLLGRAGDIVQSLSNNEPKQSNIEAGDSQFWTFSKSALQRPKSPRPSGLPSAFLECPEDKGGQPEERLELRKRQDGPNLYITINTCDQPTSQRQTSIGAPDQLKLYISTSSSNQKPDFGKNDHSVPVDGGYGSINLTVAGDVYIGVSAPTNNEFTGIYNYEIAASMDDYYAKSEPMSVSSYVDSDKQSALVYTNNTTSCNSSLPTFNTWKSLPPPFSIFVSKQDSPAILGLQNSMCGLKKHAQVQGTNSVDRSMTLSGGGQPKQQFFIKELNSSSAYYAVVGLEGTDGNSSSIGGGKVNGGGTIWGLTNFTTKSSPNCALIYDLDFCSEIAYAVPSNSTEAADLPGLRATYDSYASTMYKNFNKSLQQIPCNTTASAQYSLAVTCTDCANAYKNWLCAVTIPRCEDFSNDASYLLPRAVGSDFIDKKYGQQFADDLSLSAFNRSQRHTNGSRNPLIDEVIKPGPYKELLPCEDLCYGLVRSCPAALGFSCPLKGHGLNYTYSPLKDVGRDRWTCNFPGVDLNAATSLQGGATLAISIAIITTFWSILP